MIRILLIKLCREWPFIRPFVWKRVYRFLAINYPAEVCSCMNYGYASTSQSAGPPLECLQDAPERFSLQLYNYVTSAVEVRNQDVLEIGCGRGGGANFIKKQLGPKQLVAIDFSLPAKLPGRNSEERIHFVEGDADALPIGDQQFDVVINIESSHCYRSIEAFVHQVKRVLRPHGHFLYADFCQADRFARLRDLLCQSGMRIVKEDDITGNVLAALEHDSERRSALIKQYVSHSLSRSFREFVGIPDSRIFNDFKNRHKIYFRFVLVNE